MNFLMAKFAYDMDILKYIFMKQNKIEFIYFVYKVKLWKNTLEKVYKVYKLIFNFVFAAVFHPWELKGYFFYIVEDNVLKPLGPRNHMAHKISFRFVWVSDKKIPQSDNIRGLY